QYTIYPFLYSLYKADHILLAISRHNRLTPEQMGENTEGGGERDQRSVLFDDVGTVFRIGSCSDRLGVHVQTLGHPESPVVLHLSVEVEVDLSDEDAIGSARERGRSRSVGRRHVTAAEEVTKVLVGGFSVGRGELVGEDLSADPIDADGEDVVGNRRVARLDAPQRLTESSDGRRRIEDDLGAVQRVHHPVLRVVSAVADVDADSAESSLEDGMTQSRLHVVSGLKEVADSGDVVLPGSPDDPSRVADDDCSIPDDFVLNLVPLQNRIDDDHVVLLRYRDEELGGGSVDGLRHLRPGQSLTSAEGEGHTPCLLQADDVGARSASHVQQFAHPLVDGVPLLLNGRRRGQNDRVLNRRHFDESRDAHLLRLRRDTVALKFDVLLLRIYHELVLVLNALELASVEDTVDVAAVFCGERVKHLLEALDLALGSCHLK
ncbi:hypothetical protein PMAYCL1PPCAC_05998, partial [Pristionchus mayeri]